MRTNPSNPVRNSLPTSLEESELIRTIEASGYPLQGVVAGKLKEKFGVTEEWGFIDRDSQEHRSLDVFAYKRFSEKQEATVQPSLILLIECKRSVHPYIFFQSVSERDIPQFPSIAGLPRNQVTVYDQSGNRLQEMFGCDALGLDTLAFVAPGPPICAAFSKAVLSGKKVELSGSEPFSSIVLPLVKSRDHASQLYNAVERPDRLFPTLILCISVLDAPMILVETPEHSADPVLTPWVRIVRQEANADKRSWLPSRFYAIDAVHIDFFDEMIASHLLPFAEEFERRAVQLADVLLHGGEVPDLDNWTWDQIRPRQARPQFR